jgi:2-polyprenyl-3-methyl-5-hydroxy-6-metoxy-1,4-benzoquinol methylase
MLTFGTQIKKLGGGRIQYITELVQEPVDKILDIGCSYGWTLGALAGKADELWGIDVEQSALK